MMCRMVQGGRSLAVGVIDTHTGDAQSHIRGQTDGIVLVVHPRVQ